jgi:rubrerythrin
MPQNRPTHAQLVTEFKYAIEQEQQTYLRYAECARLTDNPKVRKLLRFLAAEERTHEEKLQRLLDELQSGVDPIETSAEEEATKGE